MDPADDPFDIDPRIRQLFLTAVNLADGDRASFIATCDLDPRSRQLLESLCAADERSSGYQPVTGGLPFHAVGLSRDELLDAIVEVKRFEGMGSNLSNYRLGERIGEGGFGVVFAAEQINPARRVAIKVMRIGLDTADTLRRFERERQTLAEMDEPGIAKIFDAGATPAGRPFFAMEFVDGKPVTRYAEEARLTIRERVALVIQICTSVKHAHRKGVIHQDITPSNVLAFRNADGVSCTKIIDFGIARVFRKQVAGSTDADADHAGFGTPPYASPEQLMRAFGTDSAAAVSASASGVAHDVDTRSDVYSIGVLLYELLTCTTPIPMAAVQTLSRTKILEAVCEAVPVKPSDRILTDPEAAAEATKAVGQQPRRLVAELQGDLDLIVLKAIAPDRERRYSSVESLAEDLERYLSGLPVQPSIRSRSYLLKKFVLRHRLPVAAAVAMITLLVGGVAGTSIGLLRERHARQLLELASEALKVKSEEARKESERADLQRASSESYAAMIEQVVSGMDPAESFGPERAMYSEIASNVARLLEEGALSENPDGSIRLRLILGTLHNKSGRPDEAEAILAGAEREASTIADEAQRKLRLAQCAQGLAIAIGSHSLRSKEALSKQVEAVSAFESLYPEDHLQRALSRQNLALARFRCGQFEGAAEDARVAIEMYSRLPSSLNRNIQLATAQNIYGSALVALGRPSDALASLESSLAIRRECFDPNHPSIASALIALAEASYFMGKSGAAEGMQREALSIRRLVFSDGDHPDLANSLNNLAQLLVDIGKADEAVPLATEACEIFERLFGRDDWQTIAANNTCANALGDLQRFEEAATRTIRNVEAMKLNTGDDDRRVVTGLLGAAKFQRAVVRIDESEALYREALAMSLRLDPAGHPDQAGAFLGLAFCSARRKNLDQAVEYARQAAEVVTRILPEQDPIRQGILAQVQRIELARDKAPKASPVKGE
ncbi:MAG: protein kinase domain-containing protein [Phycisphaerales bacterium]